MSLAHKILEYFKGREDHYAEASGEHFHPVQGKINTLLLKSQHLDKKKCLGFYVLNGQSQCFCACVDFDNKPHDPNPEWKAQAEALYYYLENADLCPLVELSQSGEGCHVWLFFSDPVAAWIPRAFLKGCGTRLGTEYKEVYPRQEKLAGPKKLGNLVRFPLWNKSVFVDLDDEWKPIPPLKALGSIRKIDSPSSTLLERASELGLGVLSPETSEDQMILVPDGQSLRLPNRVHALVCRPHTLLGKRWANNSSGMTDSSSSAVAMSLASGLVAAYVPESEVVQALNIWVNIHAPDKAARPDWVRHTVHKAYDLVYKRMHKSATKATTLTMATREVIEQLKTGGRICYPSGIPTLDENIDGIYQGEMGVLVAWPSHGKTALGLQWACHTAETSGPVLILSEEMSASQLAYRKLLSVAEIPPEHWTAEYIEHLEGLANEKYKDWSPVYIAKSDTIEKACELIAQHVRIHGVVLVMVDYIQLLNVHETPGSRYQDVTRISKMLKGAVADNDVALLALAQMNNQSEARTEAKGGKFEPQLADIKDSGQIGQDADLVLFADYPWKRRRTEDSTIYAVYIHKRRNGNIPRERWLGLKYDTARQVIYG